MHHCLLNIDLGEIAGEAEELYALADLANIACGGHAGDDASMDRALALCARYGVRVGAHPSYPDREGFGRRALAMEPAALGASVHAQCAALAARAAVAGARVAFAKPHGALYHAADRDPTLAHAVVDGVLAALGTAIGFVGPAGGCLATAARNAGQVYFREGFADRALRPDGSLVPRSERGAMIDDPERAASQAVALALRGEADTICVHGDGPHAVAIARRVRAALGAFGGAPTR